MQVDRLPDIQGGGDGLQDVPVLPGLQDRRRPPDIGQQRGPRPRGRHLVLQRPDRGRMHRRHLHRQRATRRQLRQQPREQRCMPTQPVQRGIGVDHVHPASLWRLGRPAAEIRLREPAPRRGAARLFQHRRRAIDAQHIRPRPALLQEHAHIAGPAAQIHHPGRRIGIHIRQQIERRPQPLIAVAQIDRGIPARRDPHRPAGRLRHAPAPRRRCAPGPPPSGPDGSAAP